VGNTFSNPVQTREFMMHTHPSNRYQTNRPLLTFNKFRNRWNRSVLTLSLATMAPWCVQAGPLPPDYVSQLRTKLENPSQDRVRSSLDLIDKMSSTGELSRALLLPEWQGQYLDGENLDIFNATLDKFVATAQKGLKSTSLPVRKQTARIIAETGSVNSGASSIGGAERSVARDPAFRKAFQKLQDQLFEICSTDPEVRVDALYCLGRIDSAPDRLGKLVTEVFQGKQNTPAIQTEKLAAAESIKSRANSIATLVRQRRALNIEELSRSRAHFLNVVSALIPPAVIGLSDPSPKVAVLCSDCINELTEAMVDSDIVIQVRDLDPSIQEGNDVFASRIGVVRQDQKDLLPMAKTLRSNSAQILSLGLRSGQEVVARRETLLLLEDFAVIRKKMFDQETRLAKAESLAGLQSPPNRIRDLEVFPISEEGSNSILKALVAGLQDRESIIRLTAAKSIEAIIGLPDILSELRLSDRDRLLNALLAELSEETDVYVQTNLIRVLGVIAPSKNEKIVPVLVKYLGSPDVDVRIQAVNALKNFETKAVDAVPGLSLVIDQGDPEFRIVAMKAIESIGTEASSCLPKIGNNLRHNNPEVRAYAARVLGRFGKAAADQLPELQKLLNDPSQDVRMRAEEASLQILSGNQTP
jgi:HEAT repeat protein